MASHAPEGRHEAELACELCIIGAGIAGLNALFVARQYLKATDRVILIDRRAAPGGMWNNVYDYSRLHQPHGSFTVGDIPWNWKKPAHYLATGREVQEHLIHCYETLRPAMQLTELFGHTVTACEEVETVAGSPAGTRQHRTPRPSSGLQNSSRRSASTCLMPKRSRSAAQRSFPPRRRPSAPSLQTIRSAPSISSAAARPAWTRPTAC